MATKIRQIHAESRETYGSPRVHAEFQAQGLCVSRNRVARIMRMTGLRARCKRRYRTTTQRRAGAVAAPNLVAQDFSADSANETWLADITYIDTREGWLSLAAILDVYSRKIVGWSMSPSLRTQLVDDALCMALGRRDTPPKIHHNDQGSQYTSQQFLDLLQRHRIQVSMSGGGNCYDNAMMESFFATLKTECVTHRFHTRTDARQTIFEFIEVWYNRHRRHSALGYLSPEQFERMAA